MSAGPAERRSRRRVAMPLALVLAWVLTSGAGEVRAQPAAADGPADCPPVATAPSPAQLREAAAAARDRGFLWRLERDGHRSWLYGTVHLGRFGWTLPGPTVRDALAGSDTLALELDIGDPGTAKAVAEAMAEPPDRAPRPPGWDARVARLAAAACVPMAQLAPMHPVMQAVTLSVLAGRRDGLDPAWAQEFALAALMRGQQRPVIGLESPQRQRDALVPSSPDEARRLAAQLLSQLEEDRVRPVLRQLAEAWATSDLDRLSRYEDWCDCVQDDDDRRQLHRLNDERNPALAARVDALHREGRRLFVAVGALHMTGPQSLPRLLAERGFSVERVLPPR